MGFFPTAACQHSPSGWDGIPQPQFPLGNIHTVRDESEGWNHCLPLPEPLCASPTAADHTKHPGCVCQGGCSTVPSPRALSGCFLGPL